MKTISIDDNKCVKCARCVALFPENFTLDENNGIACVKDNENAIYEMEQICMVNAIKVIENDD